MEQISQRDEDEWSLTLNLDRVLSKGGTISLFKRHDQYFVTANFRSKITINHYQGSSQNPDLNKALEKACFELLVNRAAQLNHTKITLGVRQVDEFSSDTM